MTGARTSVAESHAAFAVAATAIAVGVRCRSFGRRHLPARLSPLAISPRAGGGALVDVRCVPYNALGWLLLDPVSMEHRGPLTVWRAQPGQMPQGDNRKAST